MLQHMGWFGLVGVFVLAWAIWLWLKPEGGSTDEW